MRTSIATAVLWLVLLSPLCGAAEVGSTEAVLSSTEAQMASIQTAAPEPAASTADAPAEDAEPGPTKFNGIEVPPLKEISGEDFDEEVKEGYW